jgi:hypothetical protein
LPMVGQFVTMRRTACFVSRETAHRHSLERRLLGARGMESLVELIFVIAAVIIAVSLLPRDTAGRVVLGFGGVVLAAVGVVLFVVITYPTETLLILGAGSMITGAAWGYTHITDRLLWLDPGVLAAVGRVERPGTSPEARRAGHRAGRAGRGAARDEQTDGRAARLVAEVALDEAPEQFVDLPAMVTDGLGDVREVSSLSGAIRQRRARQTAFGQSAESTSVHRDPSPDQPTAAER